MCATAFAYAQPGLTGSGVAIIIRCAMVFLAAACSADLAYTIGFTTIAAARYLIQRFAVARSIAIPVVAEKSRCDGVHLFVDA